MTFAVQPWVRRGLRVIHKMNEAEKTEGGDQGRLVPTFLFETARAPRPPL